MKAIVQEGYGSVDVLKLREIALPAVADDGVLVRVHAASVNASMPTSCPCTASPACSSACPARKSPCVAWTSPAPSNRLAGTSPASSPVMTCSAAHRLPGSPRQGRCATKVPRARSRRRRRCRHLHGADRKGARCTRHRGDQHSQPGSRGLTLPGSDHRLHREDFALQGERFDVFFDVAATRPLRDCLRVLVPGGTLVQAGAPKGGLAQIAGRLLANDMAPRLTRRKRMPRREIGARIGAAAFFHSRCTYRGDGECNLSDMPPRVEGTISLRRLVSSSA